MAPPLQAPPPAAAGPARTLVLVLDREAEDVARAETSAVVHAAVKKRVGVGVRDVQDLASGCHVARDALVSGDADLVTLQGQRWSGRMKSVACCRRDHQTSGLLPRAPCGLLATSKATSCFHIRSPHRPPRHRRKPWPPVRSDPAGTRSSCGNRGLIHRALTSFPDQTLVL
jgi:hypothetical protein